MENTQNMQTGQLAESFYVEVATTPKRPASLGKLNRTAARATTLILAQGHGNKRFKRDYENGVSTYVCPHCSAGALVVAIQGRGKSKMEGDALTVPCLTPNLQK